MSVLFGLLPAVRFSRPNLIHALKDDAGGGGRQTIRVHRVAAIVQIGIAVPFLVLSGVMLDRVRTADFGFPDRWTGGRASAGARSDRSERPTSPSGGFATICNRPTAFARWRSPRACRSTSTTGYFESRATKDAEFVTAHVTRVGENFLETIGAPLLRGRTITLEDRVMAAPVAVISEPLADNCFRPPSRLANA